MRKKKAARGAAFFAEPAEKDTAIPLVTSSETSSAYEYKVTFTPRSIGTPCSTAFGCARNIRRVRSLVKGSSAAVGQPSLLGRRVSELEAAGSSGPAGNSINRVSTGVRLGGDICVGYGKLIFHRNLPLERWGKAYNVPSVSSRCRIGTSEAESG
jgi:hypothetical protein